MFMSRAGEVGKCSIGGWVGKKWGVARGEWERRVEE